MAATGLAVTSGLAMKDKAPAEPAAATIAAAEPEQAAAPVDPSLDERAERPRVVSRSHRRTVRQEKPDRDAESRRRPTRSGSRAHQGPREIARRLMPKYGLSVGEFGCLDRLWVSESDWDPTADNPTSTAYGIPQALTGGTHRDLPDDYRTNPVSQIHWGLEYIRKSYGSACVAWKFKQANQWY